MLKVSHLILSLLILFVPLWGAACNANKGAENKIEVVKKDTVAGEDKVAKPLLPDEQIKRNDFTTAESPSAFQDISGSQVRKGNYLKIDGTLKRLSSLKLAFTGTIAAKINFLNNGKEGKKKVSQYFLQLKTENTGGYKT